MLGFCFSCLCPQIDSSVYFSLRFFIDLPFIKTTAVKSFVEFVGIYNFVVYFPLYVAFAFIINSIYEIGSL